LKSKLPVRQQPTGVASRAAVSEEHARRAPKSINRRFDPQRNSDLADAQQVGVKAILCTNVRTPDVAIAQLRGRQSDQGAW
jgi:hypothetical protein